MRKLSCWEQSGQGPLVSWRCQELNQFLLHSILYSFLMTGAHSLHKEWFSECFSSNGHGCSNTIECVESPTTQQLSDPGFGSPGKHSCLPSLAQLPCVLRTTAWGPWKLCCQWDLDSGVRSAEASHQDSPGSGDIHSQFRSIQQQAQNRDVANPIKISSIMWHTLLEQHKGFASAGPNQVGLCGVSHFTFKSLLNPLLRLVVNSIFISVFRDDRQPSSPASPEASALPLLVESGSIHERQQSHRPSVFWLAQRKAEWQTSFQSAWPMQGNGAIWPEKGFRLLLCEKEGGWRKKSWFKSTHNAFPLGDLCDKKQPGWGSAPASQQIFPLPPHQWAVLALRLSQILLRWLHWVVQHACSFSLSLTMCLLMN